MFEKKELEYPYDRVNPDFSQDFTPFDLKQSFNVTVV